MTSYETLEVSVQQRVARVQLNRPKLRNAFNETMIAELSHAFGELEQNAAVQLIVLGGNGPVFCAGADLDWMRRMADYSHEQNLADARALAATLHAIYACSKPLLGRIHGDTYAGGMGLAAVCDVAIASSSAQFCLSETRLGLVPATIAPYVVRAMGESAARRYFVTAEKFDAAEALRIGFVHEVAASEALDARIDAVITHLMATSPNAASASKKLVRDVADAPLSAALIDDTAQRIATIRASVDGREGIRSFLEKRKARWLSEYETELAAAQAKSADNGS